MSTLDIEKKFDPTPEENRAAIAAVKAAISKKAASLHCAKVIDYPLGNSVLVEAIAYFSDDEKYQIIVATISKNFIGEDKANGLAKKLAKSINAQAKN